MSQPVRIIPGALHRDLRGEVRHANAFDFEQVDRFYTVHPARVGELRGWVGHKRDWKWFFVAKGGFEIGVVKPDNWSEPSAGLPVQRFTLNDESPQVLEIPPGYFTANRSLTAEGILLVFSSGRIEDASGDDFRMAPSYWSLGAESS